MTTSGRGTFDVGGTINAMPNLGAFRNRFLRIVGVILLLILLFASITSVPTGNVGVLTLFGRVTGDVLGEGIHLINPLKSVQKLSVQTQSVKESANVPSNEGLILALDTSLLFRLDRTKAAQVYQTVGEDYAAKIVEPTLRAAIRASTSSHTANALYTNARELVQQQIQDELTAQLAQRGVIVEVPSVEGTQTQALRLQDWDVESFDHLGHVDLPAMPCPVEIALSPSPGKGPRSLNPEWQRRQTARGELFPTWVER